MEQTMSSYSFSPQFYQRWTRAPEQIREAIIQELTDITSLLQTETPFEAFVFSAPDLDAHLDELYENNNAEQAIAKAIADKQAKYRADAEEQRLKEEEQKNQADEKNELKQQEAKLRQEIQQAETANKEQQERNKQLAADKNHLANQEVDSEINQISVDNADEQQNNPSTPPINQQTNIAHDSNIKTVIDKAVSDAAINMSLKDTKLGASHTDLIRELEMHVDDYLSEQMAQMSENLKSWLRAEVTQHLTEQGQLSDSPPKQKN